MFPPMHLPSEGIPIERTMAADPCRLEALLRQAPLGEGEAHLWQFSNLLPVENGRLEAGLSADEKARIRRFVVADVRRRFGATRAVLRQLLGAYLGADPARIVFDYGAQGKPVLGGSHAAVLAFNVSHSWDRSLIVVGRGSGGVGVDVERIRDTVPCLELARRFFSEEESRFLAGLAEDDRRRVFFRLWATREALAKASGIGLLAMRRGAAGRGGWRVAEVEMDAPGYVGVVAVPQSTRKVLCQRIVWSV